MRTEAEIREALELVSRVRAETDRSKTIKDSTCEALRFALGIDDAETTPMLHTLASIIEDMKEEWGMNNETLSE